MALHWVLDNAHSEVSFSVRHMMFAKVRGNFKSWTGTLSLNPDNYSASSVKVDIAVSSIDTANEQRDGHLRSPDFFDVEKYPSITFVSTGVRNDGGKVLIDGDLTIRDVTRPVTLHTEETGKGTDPWGNTRIGFSGSAKINRKEFGLSWNQALEAGGVLVGEDITVDIEIQVIGTKG
ncbi:MAG: YceI family protein [Myxococcales bacterium]|nr:YceI family protein [Myxococcales bacterium]